MSSINLQAKWALLHVRIGLEQAFANVIGGCHILIDMEHLLVYLTFEMQDASSTLGYWITGV